VEIAAGQTLMSQGDPGDSMYLSIIGRLRAYIRDEDGVQRMVREMARGQVIGEMALYTDEPRSATVVEIGIRCWCAWTSPLSTACSAAACRCRSR
jgi:NTE family protein